MQIIQLKCRSCGAPLIHSKKATDPVQCNHCGSKFILEVSEARKAGHESTDKKSAPLSQSYIREVPSKREQLLSELKFLEEQYKSLKLPVILLKIDKIKENIKLLENEK